MIVDTHVHVVSDDRKRYPQVSDGAHGANAPSVRDIGQVEWPPLTVESFGKTALSLWPGLRKGEIGAAR